MKYGLDVVTGGRERVAFAVLAGLAALTLLVQLVVALTAVSQLERDAELAVQDAVAAAANNAATFLNAHIGVAENSTKVISAEIAKGLLGEDPSDVTGELLVQVTEKDELRAMIVAYPTGEFDLARRDGDQWQTQSARATDGVGARKRTATVRDHYRETAVTSSAVELAPETGNWYLNALAAPPGELVWSDPVVEPGDDAASVWVSTRVRDSEGDVVVVAASLLLDPLTATLTNLPIRQAGGEAFVLTADDHVVAAPVGFAHLIDGKVMSDGEPAVASDLGVETNDAYDGGRPVFGGEGKYITLEQRLTKSNDLDWVLHVRAERALIAPSAARLSTLVSTMAWWLVATVVLLALLLLLMRRRANQSSTRADTDALTGMANRRVLDREAGRVITRTLRGDAQAIVAVLDLDDFKALNDARGHAAGDEALIALSQALVATTRSGDIVARLGGDEFVVVMPADKGAKAWAAVERLRRAAAVAVGELAESAVGVTAGFATTAAAHEDMTFMSMLERADARLVDGKRAGKGTTYGPR